MTDLPSHDPTVQCHEEWMKDVWRPWAERQISRVTPLEEKVQAMSAEMDALNAAVTDLKTELSNDFTALTAKITELEAAQANNDTAAIVALTANVKQMIADAHARVTPPAA